MQEAVMRIQALHLVQTSPEFNEASIRYKAVKIQLQISRSTEKEWIYTMYNKADSWSAKSVTFSLQH